MLSSLLANAIEALDRDGQITVRGELGARAIAGHAERRRQRTRHDAAHQLRRAGKPFHTTKPRGLGVGLALARRVIERFGGRLEIDSEPGLGTTVRLHMPAA